MLKIRPLQPIATIRDLSLNQITLGKVLPDFSIRLSSSIKAKAANPEGLKENQQVAVKITKISLPDTLEVKIINEPFTLIDYPKGISSFTMDDVGKREYVYAKVEGIHQTSGPTLFQLNDGTGTMPAKAFAGAGKRAYPDLKEGEAIKAHLLLKEYDGNVEAELLSFEKLEDKNMQQLMNKIERQMEEKSMPMDTKLMIRSDVLEKLKPRMIKATVEIKKAIIEGRTIILRHHADCDGYCGAFALEKAILSLLQNKESSWKYYRRSPTKIPYYDYTDVFKDLAVADRFKALVVMVDNGSTEEDVNGLQLANAYGIKAIVIDHHVFDENLVESFLDVHVNPYLAGGDSNITAGMLCAEIARFLNSQGENPIFLAALSGIGDKSEGSEFEQYLRLAKDYNRQYLDDVALVVDFAAYYLGYTESGALMGDLLGSDMEKQKKLISLMMPDIQKRRAEQLKAIERYLKVEDRGKFVLGTINVEKTGSRSSYPVAGKIPGMARDALLEKVTKPVIVLGLSDDAFTIRSSKDIGFNLHELMQKINDKVPYGMVSGGGHEVAGTLRFVEAAREEIMKIVMDYINGL